MRPGPLPGSVAVPCSVAEPLLLREPGEAHEAAAMGAAAAGAAAECGGAAGGQRQRQGVAGEGPLGEVAGAAQPGPAPAGVLAAELVVHVDGLRQGEAVPVSHAAGQRRLRSAPACSACARQI